MRKTYYINGSTDEQKFYKSYCNTLTRIKTLAKKLFYKTQFDVHKHDPKKTWDTSRTLLPAKPKAQTPTSIGDNSMSLSDPILIAEAFNEYFARIGKTLINKFNVDHDNAYLSYLKHSCPSFMYLYPTTPAEIFRLIRGKSGYMGRLSSQENWLVVKRRLFAAMMRPTTHIIHNKSDDPNFSTLVTRKGFVRPISPDKFSLRRVIRTTHMGAMIWVY